MKKTHEKLVRQIYRKAKKRTRAQIWQKDVILCLYVLPDQGFISIYLSAAVLLEPNPLTRPDVSLNFCPQEADKLPCKNLFYPYWSLSVLFHFL
jgi:hypothetical protein